MKWTWQDLRAYLWPSKEAPQPSTPWFGWGAATPQVIAVAVIVILFGGLAAWIIYRVIRFFGAFWGNIGG